MLIKGGSWGVREWVSCLDFFTWTPKRNKGKLKK